MQFNALQATVWTFLLRWGWSLLLSKDPGRCVNHVARKQQLRLREKFGICSRGAIEWSKGFQSFSWLMYFPRINLLCLFWWFIGWIYKKPWIFSSHFILIKSIGSQGVWSFLPMLLQCNFCNFLKIMPK